MSVRQVGFGGHLALNPPNFKGPEDIMKFDSPLERGTLIRRYKRFLADVRLADGSLLTMHCPNTGSMKHCAEPGDDVFFSESENDKRKYRQTWELSRTKRGHYIGINPGRANALVEEGLERGVISELSGYTGRRREVRYGEENSRIDFLLFGDGRADCFVEVKSVTLLEPPLRSRIGYFPDAVSSRGTRHLRELSLIAASGRRAVLLFCVQHSGIGEVRAARHIDPGYADALDAAMASGVEVLVYKARLSPDRITLWRRIAFESAP